MSHVVQIKSRVTDLATLRAAAGRCGLVAVDVPATGGYDRAVMELKDPAALGAYAVRVVPDAKAEGTYGFRFDAYAYQVLRLAGDPAGPAANLDRLLMFYEVERAKATAEAQGMVVAEEAVEGGRQVVLTCIQAGPALSF